MLLLMQNMRIILIGGAVAILSVFQMGYITAYPNTAILSFKQLFNESLENRGVQMEPNTFTWLWSSFLNVWFPGYLIGLWLTPWITEKFGRKATLIFANCAQAVFPTIFLMSGVLVLSPELLIFGRLLSAVIASVIMSALILFLQETSPTVVRGTTSCFCEFSYALTNIFGMVFGSQLVLGNNLLILVSLGGIPNLLAAVFLLPCPDTPKFLLLSKGNKAMALKSIRFYHGKNSGEATLEEIEKEASGEEKSKSSLKHVWNTPHLRHAMLVGCVCLVLQISTGIYPVVFLSTELLTRVGLTEHIAETGSIVMIVTHTVATGIGMIIIEKCGRRLLIIAGGAANLIALCFYVFFAILQPTWDLAKYGCLASLILYAFTYSVGLGPVAWFLMAELVPQTHRSLVQSFGFTLSISIALVVSFITLPVYNLLGPYSFLLLFVLPSVFCLIYLFKYMPETRGQEVHETVAQIKISVAKKKSSAVFPAESDFRADFS